MFHLLFKKKQTELPAELGIFSFLWRFRTERQRNTHSDASVGTDDVQMCPARDKYGLVRMQHTQIAWSVLCYSMNH